MLAEARSREVVGRLEFELADLRDFEPEGPLDILVTNATLQWVPDHLPLLTKLAQQAGNNQVVQRDLDNLAAQLARGNMNPGIGTKALTGTDILYARSASGARLFFRYVDGGVEIVAKASKSNESRVIARLIQLYG